MAITYRSVSTSLQAWQIRARQVLSRLINHAFADLQTLSAHRFESGPILVDNEEDKQFTVVRISEGKERTTALLEVASAMTGIGVVIHEAIIQVSAM